jgi:hypothetical protein
LCPTIARALAVELAVRLLPCRPWPFRAP